MINNPTKVRIEDRVYNINTSYKNAIECNRIAQDDEISDYERALAIIYVLFGETGLKAKMDWNRLLELAQKYLSMGQDIEQDEDNEPDMDIEQDFPFIKASFRSDYNIDLEKEDMHYWDFFNLLAGLSNSEFGNCCVLSKIRNIRNMDINDIKDVKTKQQILKAKEQFKLNKKEKVKERTAEEQASVERFMSNIM